ncbi:hypothetical protein CVT25_003838 [Psilocybe cyanescens]|uniref:FHA domain-containing protein n=1 Tax=Psilocybe cyanescens TaxID=93625 RepID=A0A409WY13_PSICY|nr:hypothetical protein CVT25_003838 [Psilocybe cyanescens]
MNRSSSALVSSPHPPSSRLLPAPKTPQSTPGIIRTDSVSFLEIVTHPHHPIDRPQLAFLSAPLLSLLYLYPLNNTWALKHIALTSLHTKIGRQTSSKTAPREQNEFFDSKVLSRQHAEVWEEVERLSSKRHESDPFELKSDNIIVCPSFRPLLFFLSPCSLLPPSQDLGIDIAGEDNKVIIHHKVATRVVRCLGEVALAAAPEDARWLWYRWGAAWAATPICYGAGRRWRHGRGQQPQGAIDCLGGLNSGVNGLGSGEGVNGAQQQTQQNFPFATRPLPSASSSPVPATAPPATCPGPRNMSGIGLKPHGKTGLTFNMILSRLQGEVQKSCEMGTELGGLRGVMGEPANLPLFPAYLPPVRALPPDIAQSLSPSHPAATAAAPAAAGNSSAGLPTTPVAVPAAISKEAARKEEEVAAEGSGTSMTLSSPPPDEQMTSVGATSSSATVSTSTTTSDTNDATHPHAPSGHHQGPADAAVRHAGVARRPSRASASAGGHTARAGGDEKGGGGVEGDDYAGAGGGWA